MKIINHAKRLRDDYNNISNNKQLLIFGTRLIEAKRCWEAEIDFLKRYNKHPQMVGLDGRIEHIKEALDILSSFEYDNIIEDGEGCSSSGGEE